MLTNSSKLDGAGDQDASPGKLCVFPWKKSQVSGGSLAEEDGTGTVC